MPNETAELVVDGPNSEGEWQARCVTCEWEQGYDDGDAGWGTKLDSALRLAGQHQQEGCS